MTGLLEAVREGVRRRIAEAAADTGPAGSEIEQILDRYLARPAGMVRSTVLEVAARRYGAAGSKAVTELAVATELLHLFALLHDDAIDGAAPPRRAVASLRGVGAPEPLLVLAGDLVYAAGFGLLAEAVSRYRLDPAIITDVRTIAARTVVGQLADLRFLESGPWEDLSFHALYRLYDVKTGLYTVAAPLVIGARVAGVDAEEVSRLIEAGTPLGRAYQLRDDLDDLGRLLDANSAAGASRPDRLSPPQWELNLAVTWLAEKARETGERFHRRSPRDLPADLDMKVLREDVQRRLAALGEEALTLADSLSLPEPGAFIAEMIAVLGLEGN